MSQKHPAADVEVAQALAQQAALHHVPKHPKRPQSRSVFRTRDGGWLVWLKGMMTNFHFRVSVVEYYGDFPAKPPE